MPKRWVVGWRGNALTSERCIVRKPVSESTTKAKNTVRRTKTLCIGYKDSALLSSELNGNEKGMGEGFFGMVVENMGLD